MKYRVKGFYNRSGAPREIVLDAEDESEAIRLAETFDDLTVTEIEEHSDQTVPAGDEIFVDASLTGPAQELEKADDNNPYASPEGFVEEKKPEEMKYDPTLAAVMNTILPGAGYLYLARNAFFFLTLIFNPMFYMIIGWCFQLSGSERLIEDFYFDHREIAIICFFSVLAGYVGTIVHVYFWAHLLNHQLKEYEFRESMRNPDLEPHVSLQEE